MSAQFAIDKAAMPLLPVTGMWALPFAVYGVILSMRVSLKRVALK